ncbi:hypothetical protein HDV01_003716 [Terramyces sp. JEL0728]|nr:hypothetical protein HDV01_003716 [Terramyces sp. JEL0728]
MASSCYMTETIIPWPQAQVTNFSIDLLVTGVIYQQLFPNFALKILFICSLMRWLLIVPVFLLSSSFTGNTPQIQCDIVAYFAEMGWYVNDQISLLSSFHRAVCYATLQNETFLLRLVTFSSLVIGLVLRIFRNPCRWEYPDGRENCWTGNRQLWDNLIVINVLFFELLLLLFIIIKLRQFTINKFDPTGMFKKTKKETLIRVCVLIPLGVCESLAYIIQQTQGAPTWINWVLTIAIYCRQFSPTIISVVILLGRLPQIKHTGYSKLSKRSSSLKTTSLVEEKTKLTAMERNLQSSQRNLQCKIMQEDTVNYGLEPDLIQVQKKQKLQ